jgi:hypothetical protein
MPPREPRPSRTATQGPKVYNPDQYYRSLRQKEPDEHDEQDMANLAIDDEPSSYRQATQHPATDD